MKTIYSYDLEHWLRTLRTACAHAQAAKERAADNAPAAIYLDDVINRLETVQNDILRAVISDVEAEPVPQEAALALAAE